MTRRHGGYGLVEVLIAMTLGSLLLLMLHRFLVPILLSSSKNSIQVHLSQQANILGNRLERDLKAADGSGLSYVENETLTALAICRRDGLGPNGSRLYERRIVVYFWRAQEKEARFLQFESNELPPEFVTDVTQAIHMESEELAALLASAGKGKLLAASVVEFRPIQSWPPEPPIEVMVRLEQATGGSGRKATYTLRKRVAFR